MKGEVEREEERGIKEEREGWKAKGRRKRKQREGEGRGRKVLGERGR